MSKERKKLVWPWIVTVMISLPVLYVLSSGPMRMVMMRMKSEGPVSASTTDGATVEIVEWSYCDGSRWLAFYRPLVWASQRRCGSPLNWYWDLFPVRGD